MTISSPASPPPAQRRILIRGVNWLGDAVMTTPALQRLRQALPDAHLTLLAPDKLADLWQHHPSLDSLITFAPGESPWSVGGRLRAAHFQTALVLPNSHHSALEIWLSRIPQRIGCARFGRNWLLTQAIAPRPEQGQMSKRSASEIHRLVGFTASPPPPAPASTPPGAAHQIHDYLHLTAALGASTEPIPPALAMAPAEIEQAEAAFLAEWRNTARGAAPGKPPLLLGLNPGAQYGPAKRWPAKSFAAVVRTVSQRLSNCVWVGFGSPSDWQLCEDIARLAGGNVLNLAGKTSLRQLMALLKLCRVLLTNDSGPMHVAAALGTPVVVPFGSTSPELTGPGLPGDPRHRLLKSSAPCAPCFRRDCPIDFRCMTGITPDHVSDSIFQLLPPR
jgi:heptosyltransferase II